MLVSADPQLTTHIVQTCSDRPSLFLSHSREEDVEGGWWQTRLRHPEPPGLSPSLSTSPCCFLATGPHGTPGPLTLSNEVLPCSKSFLKAEIALVRPLQAQTLPSHLDHPCSYKKAPTVAGGPLEVLKSLFTPRHQPDSLKP